MTENDIFEIEKNIAKGERIELIPCREGAIMVRIKRETIRRIPIRQSNKEPVSKR